MASALEDTMENGWGVKFLSYTEKRSGARTFQGFKRDIEAAVPDFTLDSVHMCGTDANAVAISLATDRNHSRCLFGIGSYIGGDEFHQSLSSSGYKTSSTGMAMIKPYDEVNPMCQQQSVALPYHVPCRGLDKKRLSLYEDRCLLHLHSVLLHAEFIGFQYKALFLEYILGGNGGELSEMFLVRLGRLLKCFNVAVVADEILTGGRTGRTVTMTTNMPAEFVECVNFITMGKYVGCGLVLTRRTKYSTFPESLRGFSTQAECGLPSKLFQEVKRRVEEGMLEQRRAQVLKLMKCSGDDKKEDHWGRGLLVFTAYKRVVKYGLKNRLLPRLETTKLVKNSATRTEWTRSTVCEALMKSVDDWVSKKQQMLWTGKNAFTTGLLNYLFFQIIDGNRDEDKQLYFKPDDVVEFLGPKGVLMAEEYNNWQTEIQGRRSYARASTLVKRAIRDAITNTRSSRRIYRKRLGNKRSEYNVFDATVFDVYAG